MAGFLFSSTGASWEAAYEGALAFLRQPEGILLLGPSIGDYGREWLEEKSLPEAEVRFGARIQDWKEWVRARAREQALADGVGFRTLNLAGRREQLRVLARSMAESGAFHHLREIWSEERFFTGLVGCVAEARRAGLDEEQAIERARELLGSGEDAVRREAYEDFWQLLLLLERLRLGGERPLDDAALLRLAAANQRSPEAPLFLLGFDELSLLEAELLQKLALQVELRLPLALSCERIRAQLQARPGAPELPAELALRALLTGFSGERRLLEGPGDSGEAVPPARLLAAHSPAGEARAAAALLRCALAEGRGARVVAPPGHFEEGGVAAAFLEELGLPDSIFGRRALDHPLARVFFHVLELKRSGYTLAHGLELGRLLAQSQGRFQDLASRAARAGVRKGLVDWKLRARGDAVLGEFGVLLERIDRLLPERGSAEAFAEALGELAEICGIANVARAAPGLGAEEERGAHAALAAVLRNAQMLAAATRSELSFEEWVAELRAALAGAELGERWLLAPRLGFFSLGEWLPPAEENGLTLLLGLNQGAGPAPAFGFFLEDAARRKLSDLALPTELQRSLGFLDQLTRVARSAGCRIFSRFLHDSAGRELEGSWVSGCLPLVAGSWPELSPEEALPGWRPPEENESGSPGLEAVSASLLESYRECPFRCFAERILGLEDKVQSASLDLSRLEEGSFVHKVLELFYGRHQGKDAGTPGERERLLGLALEEAADGVRREYFQGNEALLDRQLGRLRVALREFLRIDAENYARFPFFGAPRLELALEGRIGAFPFRGKVDRVDLDGESRRFLVTDYKIGASTPTSGEVRDCDRLQLQLYLDAVQAAMPGWEPIGGLYSSVSSGERNQGLLRRELNASRSEKAPKPGDRKYHQLAPRTAALRTEEEFASIREAARAEALRLAEAVTRGSFPVRPRDEETSCGRCAVRPACRIRELRSPPMQREPREAPERFLALLDAPAPPAQKDRRAKEFNPEQQEALEREGGLVFVEASAGTGKTTVIVERIRRFLAARLQEMPAHRAVEGFVAISFTEKSAAELGARAARALLEDPAFGPRLASQAQSRISTIHGFCRRILADFPVEAGISPMAGMLDEREAGALRLEVLEELFLFPEAHDPGLAALLEKGYSAFSRSRLEELLLELLAARPLFGEEFAAVMAGSGSEILPQGLALEVLQALLGLCERLALAYQKRKRELALLDFQDLESLSLAVLSLEKVQEHYRRDLGLVLVDEFQDTNSLQRSILERLARPAWSNFFVVGDAKQSIYRFRAADVSVFQKLRRQAAEAGQLVTLHRNYRSRAELVACANRISAAIFPPSAEAAADYEALHVEAVAEQGSGGRVRLIEYGEPGEEPAAAERREREAELVAAEIARLRAREGPPKEIALLLRKIAGNESFLRALTRAGIPFRIGASRGFYAQPLVTDSIALLRVLYGAKNDLALLSVLRSPWGRLGAAKLLEISRRSGAALWDQLAESEAPLLFAWKRLSLHCSPAALLQRALREYPQGRRERLQAEKLLGILNGLEREARPAAEIVGLLSAWSGWEREDGAEDDSVMPEPEQEGCVRVMTVHAAKGLEFDATILADLPGLLRAGNSPLRLVRGVGAALKLEGGDDESYKEIGRSGRLRELAELKRLFYVAVTRAKRDLIFVLPRSFPAAEPARWSSFGHFLRAAGIEAGEESGAAPERTPSPGRPQAEAVAWPAPPQFPRLRSSSITEIAAYSLCPEFHRKKYVLAWDDRIVELWPKPRRAFRKFQGRKKPGDPESERVAGLLRRLRIERKERGIALHRVLERIRDPGEALAGAELWLREAYEAQGANVERAELGQLIALDLALLRRFLSSEAGRRIFDPASRAFPELPFEWRVHGVRLHGAMDRLLERPDGGALVVDYKSSVREESLERYEFQLRAYMAAVAARREPRLSSRGRVEGMLVDLFSAEVFPVDPEAVDAVSQIKAGLEKTASGYTPSGIQTKSMEGPAAVRAGDHCFSCAYALHCEIGAPFVLA